MKCPVCELENKKSILRIGPTMGTLVCFQSYYDEDGNYHNIDPNTYTTEYTCSNNHSFRVSKCGDIEKITIHEDHVS